MKKKTIGIGLLGTGFMCKAHSNAYKTIPYMFNNAVHVPELVEIGGSSNEKAQAAAERYGFASYSEGWEHMIKNPDINTIDICTPDKYHVQPALDAILAGKNVICEKPLALSGAEAAKLVSAAEKAGVLTMTGFNYRFIPAVRLAYELLRQGILGEIYHMNVRYFQAGGADPDQLFEDTWYARPPKCGVLQGIGTHAIDQARFLAGEVKSLSALATTHVKTRKTKEGGSAKVDIEDSARAIVEFESGATGAIECSCMAWGRRNQLAWEINGSKGSVSFDLEEPCYLNVFLKEASDKYVSGFTRVNVTLPDHPFMDIWWPAGHNTGWEHAHINMIAHFLDCVAEGKPVAPLGATFTDGFKAAVIVDSIRESSRTGQRIDISSAYKRF